MVMGVVLGKTSVRLLQIPSPSHNYYTHNASDTRFGGGAGEVSTPSDSLWEQLGVLLFNSILTPSISGSSIRSHRLKAWSHKTAPLQTPTSRSRSPGHPQLLFNFFVNKRFLRAIPWV